ncbi:ATP-binding protein [Lusitaniella coriacea]|uniref:ATP-binding protein n=1 Tax=Lusitaniella coriacea TaxID=1983105 RepID=UPI003CE71240
MIAEIEAMLECYRAVCISLPVVERSRALQRLTVEVAPRLGVPVCLWNLGLLGWNSLRWDEQRQHLDWSPHPSLELSQSVDPSTAAVQALAALERHLGRGLFVAENLPSLLVPEKNDRARVVRAVLLNLMYRLGAEADKFLVLLDTNEAAMFPAAPTALGAIVPSVRWSLPDGAEIARVLQQELGESANPELRALTPPSPNPSSEAALSGNAMISAVSGLSEEEIRLGIRWVAARRHRGLAADKAWSELLLDYKIERFRAMGLTFVPRPAIPTFGGLERVKRAIASLKHDFAPRARRYNIPLPKGWLVVGPPGTGKSLLVKVCAAQLGFPLVSAPIGDILDGGAAYLAQLLRRVEAAAPAVLWLDEFDKFFIGTGESGAERGNSAQILGVLLNWLQEKRSPVFVLAALNRLDALPPELTRSGRFDKIFYADFPQAIERKAIFALHLSAYDSRYQHGDGGMSEKEWRRLLSATNKCSGAEIFEMVKNAAGTQYRESLREGEAFEYRLGLEELLRERELLTPLYVRDTDRIIAMENQAKSVSEPASDPDASIFAPVVQTLWGEAVDSQG